MSLVDDGFVAPAMQAWLQAYGSEACEKSLAQFLIEAWSVIDPGTPLVWGHPMDAIADHLQAVDSGQITRLLITVFPGASKSSLTNVAFPAWAWLRRPHLRFICTSYSEKLTQRDNDRCRRIIGSEWFQRAWGDRFKLVPPNRPDKFENDKTGWKLATSVGGQLLGQRGDVIILDDPNSPEVESDQVRATTNRWFKEVVPTRLNDMNTGAIVVIQQRLHLEDVAGIALESATNWCHLNIPMEYEPRSYVNGYRTGSDKIETFFDDEADAISPDDVFWHDWRSVEGELAWPKRFSREVVDDLKVVLGPTMANAQLQQRPIPRGGAIIKSEWWQAWGDNEPFPPLDYVVASLDTAYTSDTKNDPSAMTVWGVNHDEFGNPRVFLLYAWEEWLEFHDLLDKVIDTCTVDKREVKGPRFPVHKLLIENSAAGKSVVQELARLVSLRGTFGVEAINVGDYGGDKVSRLYSIEHVFSQKMVYAHNRSWSQKVIDQCASVPYTSHDDLADTVAQAIRWLRDMGYAPPKEQAQAEWAAERAYRPKLKPLYPVY